MTKFQVLVLKSLIVLMKAVILNNCHTGETTDLIHDITAEIYK
jgi:hypothetical protein